MSRQTIALAVVLALALAGCGGHRTTAGSTNTSTGASRATFTMRWPERNARLVPTAANSVKVTLTYGSTWTREQTADRPAGGGFSTLSFDEVPVGSVVAAATAYPEAGAKGVAQASGSVTITTTAGQAASVPLTMASTVTRLEVTGPARLMGGATGQYQAAARNATGEVVLVPKPTWRNTSGGDRATLDTVSADGTQASIRWLAPGRAAFEVAVEQVTGDAASAVTGQLAVGLLGGLANSAWPKAHHDLRNTGLGVGRGATGTKRWEAAVGCNATGSPVLGEDGTVYVPAGGSVCALDAATGHVRWQSVAIGATKLAVAADHTVFVAAGLVYALDGATGALSGASTVGLAGALAIGVDGAVYATTARSGYPGELYALDGSTLDELWHVSGGGNELAIGDDGRFYRSGDLAGPSTVLAAVDGGARAQLWQRDWYRMPSVTSGGALYATSDAALVASEVVALDGATGAPRWVSGGTAPSMLAGPAAIGPDGTVYCGTSGGDVIALNGATGAARWQVVAGRVYYAPALGADGTVYIGSSDSRLYAFDGATGAKRWEASTGGAVGAPAIGADGTVYVCSDDGKVYAIQ